MDKLEYELGSSDSLLPGGWSTEKEHVEAILPTSWRRDAWKEPDICWEKELECLLLDLHLLSALISKWYKTYLYRVSMWSYRV